MGKLAANQADRADRVEDGVLNAAGVTPWMNFGKGLINLTLWGNFVGEVVLERSFDGGVTPITCTALGSEVVFTRPATEVLDEPEAGVRLRINFRARNSGSVSWRLSK